MKFNLVFTGLLCSLFINSLALAGPGGTAGGDGIKCDFGTGLKPYAYDFVMSAPNKNDYYQGLNRTYLSESNAISILKNIKSKLDSVKSPDAKIMADGLNNFILNIKSEVVKSGSNRVWSNTGPSLKDINDKQNLRQEPEACMQNNKPALFQAVDRTYDSKINIIVYDYNENDLNSLENNEPIQLSYIYVHEWLRDYTNDVTVIKNINRFLHSDEFEPKQINLEKSFTKILLSNRLVLNKKSEIPTPAKPNIESNSDIKFDPNAFETGLRSHLKESGKKLLSDTEWKTITGKAMKNADDEFANESHRILSDIAYQAKIQTDAEFAEKDAREIENEFKQKKRENEHKELIETITKALQDAGKLKTNIGLDVVMTVVPYNDSIDNNETIETVTSDGVSSKGYYAKTFYENVCKVGWFGRLYSYKVLECTKN